MMDVPDPSDFPTPDLRALDASLRCTICGELYDGPVMLTGCGHCFCSVCVRQHIQRESDCPSCRMKTSEVAFRPNSVLEEVVGAWKEARKHVLDMARVEQTLAARSHASVALQTIPESSNPPSASVTPSSARSLKRKRRNVDYVSDSESSEVVLVDGSPTPKKRPGKVSKVSRANRGSEQPSSDPEEIPLDPNSNEIIDCPMCGKRVPLRSINPHIDSGCKDVGRPPSKISLSPTKARNNNAKTQWSSLFGAGGGSSGGPDSKGKGKGKDRSSPSEIPTERLANASYDVLKDKQIKQLLAEQNLPTTGDRKAWIRRHKHYLIIHNATLDKAMKNRSTFAELRQELKHWEDEKAKKPASAGVSDVVEYTKANDGEFKRLVQEARRNTKKPPPKDASPGISGQSEKTPSPVAPDIPVKSEDMET
ncbi:hypothetical protein CONPUDRAFT_162684 [Coniophora puteana RWD-64-598 SS2]|uniref:Postreplication repair E3 ubiquitin-protein ligase RAD18 n=1 Tax=Coniophora puteana (strain RWD-64-598) TaxID=741705 RepID=A0A5M3N2A4_CONPW|nr:uncharacterized protein CONPUDRAFT_162684 [Coniophora puteana RWD-64-598 SS2]EIW85498.1 hypothetical protein CONPUDRAFT_162684 [Coniophora puteana RWD-64-598 SS2]